MNHLYRHVPRLINDVIYPVFPGSTFKNNYNELYKNRKLQINIVA